jgi:hypothetical protein
MSFVNLERFTRLDAISNSVGTMLPMHLELNFSCHGRVASYPRVSFANEDRKRLARKWDRRT